MTSTIKCLEIDSELEKHSIIIAWNYWQRHYCHVIFFIHDTYPTINWNRIITVNYVLIKFCCIIFIFAMWQRNYFHMISLCNIAQFFFPTLLYIGKQRMKILWLVEMTYIFLAYNLRIFFGMWLVFLITDISSSKPVTQSVTSAGPYNKKLQLTISSTDRESILKCLSGIENTFTTVNELWVA